MIDKKAYQKMDYALCLLSATLTEKTAAASSIHSIR